MVAVLVWRWLFNDLYGILNHFVMWTGVSDMPVDWLGSMPNALLSVILVGAWKYFPFVVIATLARLQTIPDSLYEASKIDGAGPIARFFDITLPQLRDVLVVIIMLRAIWDFKEFDLIYLLTGGGPVTSTQTIPLAGLQGGFCPEPDGHGLGLRCCDDGADVGVHDCLYPTDAGERAVKLTRRILFNVIAWGLVLAVAFPLFWMIVTSLKPGFELFRRPPTMLPETVTFEHYWRLLTETPFLLYFRNSVILASATTFVVVSIGTLGAYSLVRFRYRGRESLAFLVLFTYLLPSVVLIIPLYLFMVNLGLSNTITSLVIAYTTFALPYALWLLRSFMAGIPEDLESAAMVDGASRLGAFRDVILPQLLPGIISTALFTFILAWNEYLYALVLVNSDGARPLTTGVMTMLISAFNIEWSLLMAASVMMSVPLIVVFAFLQSYLTRGFGAGAVKG